MPAALLLPAISFAETRQVALNEVASALKTAKPGDRIQVKDGTYTDVMLKWNGQGAEKQPVVIEAVTPGKVVITGKSALQLSGEYMELRGFLFDKVEPVRRGVVEFAVGSKYANHCRITDCVFNSCNVAKRDEPKSYIVLSGRYNRVDHCSLVGKLNLGVTLLVNLNGEGCLENFHRIDHNYFGPRGVYGSNGAETMRIGTSHQSYSSSNTIVEDNLFDRCSGEVEIISVKSCDNIVRRNVILDCEGVVALRHGKRNLVENNLFIGHGKRNTGGVRIVDEGHRVLNNVFYELAGERFFSTLAVMNGVPNSLPSRYVKANNVTIKGNTYINCSNLELGTGNDAERTEAPVDILFADNKILNKNVSKPFLMIDEKSGYKAQNNVVSLAKDYVADGFKNGKVALPKIPTEKEMYKDRGAAWYDALNAGKAELKDALEFNCRADIAGAVANAPAGSIIRLTEKEYVLTGSIIVDKPLIIRGEGSPVIRYAGESSENFITIADGGSLEISGVVIDGRLEPGKRLASAGISTATYVVNPYNLKVENCVFRNFGESGFCAVKGTKSTFAESVIVRNCRFFDNAGNGIDFSAERDDKGRYNAEDIIIENCTFHRFLGLPVNIYRGGSDESTAGPYVTISGCTFDDCCNRQRGSVMRLIGPQHLDIAGCNFINSGRGGATIRLDETSWEKIAIHGCTFKNSGKVISSTDMVKMYDNKHE